MSVHIRLRVPGLQALQTLANFAVLGLLLNASAEGSTHVQIRVCMSVLCSLQQFIQDYSFICRKKGR